MLNPRLLSIGFLLLTATFCMRAAHAATQCKVVDLMPAFWSAWKQPDVSRQLHATVIDPHPDLYNTNYVDLPAGARWEEKLQQEGAYVQQHRDEIDAAEAHLTRHVPEYMTEFSTLFPDYRCDFTFYIAPSFGNMDGAAAIINGEHRIIFAPDVIPRYHQVGELKVLIDHETFHIYHHQATMEFGAGEEAVPSIIAALWSEGLATFVSGRMNPEASLDAVLLQPGIPEGAQPHLAAIAKDLAAHLDEKDEKIFGRYFLAGRQPDGYPPRAGYYVGMLIAQKLSAHHSLQELAHLKAKTLRGLVVEELAKMASGQ